MLINFLSKCTPVIPEERADFEDVCSEMASKRLFTSYVPSICLDLWPIYVLQFTGAKCYSSPHSNSLVCLVPIGAHGFWGKPEYEKMILDFYRNDEFPSHCNIYDYDIEEMILLRYPDFTECLDLREYGSCNVVYLRVSRAPCEAHIILLLEHPADGWKSIVEGYDIPVNMLVDSHKGLGGWFEDSRLYSYMNDSKKRMLLPQYYFKGKYISTSAPEGYSLLREIEESGPHDCMTKIYRTPWQNKE